MVITLLLITFVVAFVVACLVALWFSLRGEEVTMKRAVKRILFWTPRLLGVLFALFVSLFALDVFGAGYSFWETVLALFMHLIPVYILLIALAIAWRWEWAGALLFTGFSVWYLVISWGPFPVVANLVGTLPIAGPPLLVGLLFLLNWLYKPKLQGTNRALVGTA